MPDQDAQLAPSVTDNASATDAKRRTLTEADLADLLPELRWVSSSQLRTSIVAVWSAAWNLSDWDSLQDVPKSAGVLPPARTLLAHTASVARLAVAAAEIIQSVHDIGFDKDELVTIALLHDVSKVIEAIGPPESPAPSQAGRLFQHATFGAHLMWNAGFSDRIVHGVLAHTVQSATVPATWESILVHYVDYLDSDALLFTDGLPLFLTK
jgi:putative nucleotidyltransferase with HDIG domain